MDRFICIEISTEALEVHDVHIFKKRASKYLLNRISYRNEEHNLNLRNSIHNAGSIILLSLRLVNKIHYFTRVSDFSGY